MADKRNDKHLPQPPAIDKQLSPAAPGDVRTPDKTIGEIKYANDEAKRS